MLFSHLLKFNEHVEDWTEDEIESTLKIALIDKARSEKWILICGKPWESFSEKEQTVMAGLNYN